MTPHIVTEDMRLRARDGQELPPATPTDKYVVTKADRGHALRAKLVGKGALKGTGQGLGLTTDMVRILTVLDRLGKLD